MTHDPGLNAVFARSRKRRKEERGVHLPFCYTIYDMPDALTNVEAACVAIEEEHEIRSRPRVPGESVVNKRAPIVAPSIADAVEEALVGAHPKHFARLGRLSIVSHVICQSGKRNAPVPEVPEGAGPASVAGRLDDDVVGRARDRIARLRGDA